MRPELLQLLGVVLTSIGLAATLHLLVIADNAPLRTSLVRYVERLDRELRFLRSNRRGAQILAMQGMGTLVCLVMSVVLSPVLVILEVGVIAAPLYQLKQQHGARLMRLEGQLDSWMLALANALKAVPSIGDAISSSQALTIAPLSEELDVALKEYRLGTPLDHALANMGERLGSRVVSTALTILQVARRSGGDLPTTLETSAAGLREMARLEGVVRTKTADGRNQAWVIGALPAVMVIVLQFVNPDMLAPLYETTIGNLAALLAFLLWAGAIALAMRILKVDI